MTYSDVQICSNALLLLGANPINSFTDGTVEAEISSSFYEGVLKSVLTERRWSFAIGQQQLSQLVSTPVEGYEKAYQLPSSLLKLVKVYPEWIRYELFENNLLYTDYDGEIVIEFMFKPSESSFPGYFIEYLETRLALKFCIPITEDAKKFEIISDLVDKSGRMARTADSQQRKGVGIKRFPMVDVRG